MKHSINMSGLVLAHEGEHRVLMRLVPLLMMIGGAYGAIPSWAGDVAGLWKVTPPSSIDPRYSGERLTVRFELHGKGEVFTLNQVDGDGRSTTSSTILYLDSKPRDFQGFGCSGTQASRRLGSETVEILRTCANGDWTRFVRRLSTQPTEMFLEITEQLSDGRRFARRLVLEKQFEAGITQPKKSANEGRER